MTEFFIVGVLCVIIAGMQKYLKKALMFSFMLLTAFLAIRYQFGSDYLDYQNHFVLDNYGSLDDVMMFERLEIGWIILCRLFNPLGFFGMVIVLTIFEHVVLYWFIKKHVPSSWYWLAVFSYIFSTTLCLTGVSMMRQFLAMCICLISFDLALNKKNVVWALSLVFLAATFHTSTYLCIPFCFIGFLKDVQLSRTHIIFISVAVVLLFIVSIELLGNYLQYFVANSVFDTYESRFVEDTQNKIGISTFVGYFILFYILFMQRFQNPANRKFVLIFLWYIIIQSFGSISPLINRMGLYFYMLFPVCFPNAINKTKNKELVLAFVALFIVLRLYNCYTFITEPGWGNSFLEYKTIFSVGSWM